MAPYLTLTLSLLGGVLPALFWLWFWLREDKLHPEPKKRIALVFLAGTASVLVVLPIEKFLFGMALGNISILIILSWAAVEEIFKYLAAYWSALRGKEVDEPIDPAIYMITAALGFSALENALFLFNVIDVGLLAQGVITGNSRFLGATLLHIASSASIGVMMGLAYYKKPPVKKLFLAIGISIAILLHTIFNLFIIKLENNMFFVFAGVWVVIIALIVLMEKLKTIRS